MLNRSIVIGRLCADPELKYTPQNTAVCTIRLAVDRDYTKQDGNRDTDFIDVVCWTFTAEFVAKNFLKGQMIAVEGRLQSRKWKDKFDQNRTEHEIVAEKVHKISRTPASDAAQPVQAVPAGAVPVAVHPTIADSFAEVFPDDDDVPF